MKVIERMKEKGGVLIGMVHCLPLPGTMNYGGSMDAIVDKATEDAHALETAGFDAVLVEATMDKPMGMVRGPLQLAAMSVICGAVHRAVHIPMGVSYLTPDCRDVLFHRKGQRSRLRADYCLCRYSALPGRYRPALCGPSMGGAA